MTPGGFLFPIGVGVTVEITGLGVSVTGFFWVLLVGLGYRWVKLWVHQLPLAVPLGFLLVKMRKKKKEL